MSDLLRLALPITAWLAGFSALYGLQGFACSDHWPLDRSAMRPALITSALALIALQTALLLALHHPRFAPPDRFTQTTALLLAVAALLATGWTAAPVAVVTVCG